MSLITRCPACETLFKVVPDQLRISEGWVRCGHCEEIFDASFHLVQGSPASELPVAPLAELGAPDPAIGVEDSDAPSTPDGSPDLEDAADFEAQPEAMESVALESIAAVIEAPTPLSAALADPVAEVAPQEMNPPLDLDINLDMAFDAVAQDDALSQVSFLQEKKIKSDVRRPIMTALLLALNLVLLLGFTGQVMLHERDQIVAAAPGLKPLFLAICSPLNCTLSPLRRIESIVIESASFTKIRADSYRLNFTVKNTSTQSLAFPAVELTLTDALDQPVVRHVILPSTLGVNSEALTAGAVQPSSLALSVRGLGPADRVAGYRLEAFYP